MTEPFRTEIFVAPGVPVVRSNTPKPPSFGGHTSNIERSQLTQPPAHDSIIAPGFPVEAPVAPPLPEESEGEGNNTVGAVVSIPVSLSGRSDVPNKVTPEFVWLFEYGSGMDTSILNSPEWLNGLALAYGPAVLKGYHIAFDAVEPRTRRVVANIQPGPGGELAGAVWGVLYRIPRRLTERRNDEASLLDKLHLAMHFEPQEVIVYEAYRRRDISCITYIASAAARQQFHRLPKERQVIDDSYMQHLLECARQQKLPGEYLEELARFSAKSPEDSMLQNDVALISASDVSSRDQSHVPGLKVAVQPDKTTLPIEQNTEPLPVLTGKTGILSPKKAAQGELHSIDSSGWLMAFSLYLVLLFLVVLTLSVILALGFWSNIFTTSFAPLGTPWFVLVYGLLGGCVSGIVTIGRRSTNAPGFVVVTWFTRPFIAALLAALAYLALSSGLFVLNGNAEQRYALFALVGALAGLCERWIFFRWA